MMDSEAIEQAIDEELEKLSLNLSDVSDVDSDGDTDTEDDFDASNRKLENDLPQSVLTYFEASHNRVNTFEQLILEDLDLDENDTACTELSHQNHFENLLNELDCNPEEDLTELKERIISEIEEHVAYPSDGSCLEDTKPALHMNDETECGVYKEAERQLIYEWVELEEKLKKEEEQRLAELEAEKEHHLNSVREEEEKRRCRLEEFEEELRKIENTCLVSEDLGGDSHIKERIQLELAKQQEVIKKLEEQLEEEKRAYEEAQQEERRKTEEQRSGAATKLQAALRGVLVRRWSKNELIKRKEEVRRRQEEIEERERRREREERMKKEREEERKRVAAEEQHQKEELERRRVEYERAKERERHRLEKERKLEEQRRREEEAKRMEDERKRKGDEERTKRMEEERKEEERRRLEEEERKLKEEKKKEELESKQMQKERKQLEEKESKGKEGEVIERDGWTMEERGMRQKEKRKGMEEHRMCTESSVDDENRKRKDKEKKKEELESKQMQKERKQLEEKESKEEDGKVKKRIEEKDEQTMEERRMREEERGKRMEEERTEEEERRVEEERRKSKEGKSKKLEEEKKKKKEQLEGKVMQEEQRKNLAEKQSEEEEGKVMKRNEKRDGHELEERTREEHRKSVLKEDGKGLDDQRCFLKTGSKNTKKNSEKGGKEERSAELVPQPCLSQSNKSPNGISASPKSSSYGHHQICSADPTDNNIALMAPALDGAQLEVKMYVEKSEMDTRGHPCETASSIQNCAQNTRSICLPDSTEQKRLSWMMNCTPWSKLSMQTKRKGLTAPSRKRAIRRPSLPILPPLPVDTVLKSGPWSTLRQVTTVTLEDLPGFSLSTLSECTSLQSLTLRCCGLQALEGLQQCSELRHIDVQENCITYVDLGGLERLEFLMLGRNQLTSIPGLDSAVNLTVLQLSHNIISRISGLGSLKRLQRLSVDHNQLISTRGLSDAFTLLYLDCSFNHLSHVEGLEHCALLNTLDLRGNSLTELPVLKNHVLLRELYLDDNSISSLHGLDSCWLPLLRCLSVAQNNITQLPLLVDLLSLRTLDISHNCLSELRNVCLSLQGCARLQELNLSDNPLQLENNWRSSVLTAKPSLVKLNGDLTGASVEPSVGSTQLWSFQALCQAHQDQLDSVLQRQSMEISLAPSMLDAQLLARNHGTELFRLAEEQRYAHEYGDSSVSETAAQEPGASSCLHDVSDGDLTKYESPQLHPGEQETQSQRRAHLTGIHKSHPEHQAADLPADCVVGCINPLKKFREEQSGYSRHTIKAARMDLKTMAAIVIQRFWRKHRQSRRTGPSEPPAKANGRWSPQQRAKSNEKSLKPLNKDYAATVIQAVWRGYALRRRLARALALAQISEGDEAFEEVDVDEFIFDEEAMESDWIALHSDASLSGLPPYLEQLLLPKPRLLLPELSTPVLPWKPKQAWTGSEVAVASEQSPDPDIRMQSPPSTRGRGALSERSEKILEEWGISCGSTALLMLKRAKKMKARNQEQKKLLDPAVRLALFRNNSKQPVPINIRKRPQPECKDDIKAGRAEVSVENALSGGPGRLQQHRTYQWLHTQAEQTQRSSDSSTSDRFLPEIDPDILNGGRVQLVAGARYRESPDSAARLWSDATGFSPLCNQHAHVRRHSVGHAKKEVPSPKRVTSAPSRKERISFRDNPVRLSGGWGGGKKRAKVNK
ncbi:leucine-rich repeat and IQ domain-containing protein 1 [Colossoma macropomum]|uniref:leucine-rich repeat and IQ domain-containing protein 1 n=1 Tax=Colossoma macropomum TaxID=42526 RepID=UPI00186492C3|nr:leucine-rich repeat and IQ domain-containing protein 1 [Colossoma macropomum]